MILARPGLGLGLRDPRSPYVNGGLGRGIRIEIQIPPFGDIRLSVGVEPRVRLDMEAGVEVVEEELVIAVENGHELGVLPEPVLIALMPDVLDIPGLSLGIPREAVLKALLEAGVELVGEPTVATGSQPDVEIDAEPRLKVTS